MKVFNLTDIETPALKQRGMSNQTFAVGPRLLGPGDSADVPPEYIDSARAGLQSLIEMGAAAVREPPAAYRLAKERMAPPPPPPPPVVVAETVPAVEEAAPQTPEVSEAAPPAEEPPPVTARASKRGKEK